MFKKPSATKWHRRTAPVAKPGEPLSLMEMKILNWCSKGDTKARTAKRLGISESYVKFFFERIHIKLRVRTQGHADRQRIQERISQVKPARKTRPSLTLESPRMLAA